MLSAEVLLHQATSQTQILRLGFLGWWRWELYSPLDGAMTQSPCLGRVSVERADQAPGLVRLII